MTSAIVIGMLVAILVGLKTNSIVLAVITWIVVGAVVYILLKLLHGGLSRGVDAAADAISKAKDKADKAEKTEVVEIAEEDDK